MASSWEDRIRGLIDSTKNTLGGIGFDPKAAARPGESVGSYMGRRIRESASDAFAPVQRAATAAGNVVSDFMGGISGPATVPTETSEQESARWANWNRNNVRPASAPESVTRPEGTAAFQPSTGISTPAKLTERQRIAGIATRISPENPYGADVVGGGMRTGQVRVGAGTDAEAARNLQARELQDQAASAEAARLDRATEAMRSLREAQSPAFSFGVRSIGGGPDPLDVASGRVIDRDTPANVVAGRMANAVQDARRFGVGGKGGRLAAEQIGKSYLADKEMQQAEMESAARMRAAQLSNAPNPLDMQRFLLDREKFAQQQGVDEARLRLDAGNLQNQMAGTKQKAQEYEDAQRKSFMEGFSSSMEGAPNQQIANEVWKMSRATGGRVSPEEVAMYYDKVAKAEGIDWTKGGPKDLRALNDKVMAAITAANQVR